MSSVRNGVVSHNLANFRAPDFILGKDYTTGDIVRQGTDTVGFHLWMAAGDVSAALGNNNIRPGEVITVDSFPARGGTPEVNSVVTTADAFVFTDYRDNASAPEFDDTRDYTISWAYEDSSISIPPTNHVATIVVEGRNIVVSTVAGNPTFTIDFATILPENFSADATRYRDGSQLTLQAREVIGFSTAGDAVWQQIGAVDENNVNVIREEALTVVNNYVTNNNIPSVDIVRNFESSETLDLIGGLPLTSISGPSTGNTGLTGWVELDESVLGTPVINDTNTVNFRVPGQTMGTSNDYVPTLASVLGIEASTLTAPNFSSMRLANPVTLALGVDEAGRLNAGGAGFGPSQVEPPYEVEINGILREPAGGNLQVAQDQYRVAKDGRGSISAGEALNRLGTTRNLIYVQREDASTLPRDVGGNEDEVFARALFPADVSLNYGLRRPGPPADSFGTLHGTVESFSDVWFITDEASNISTLRNGPFGAASTGSDGSFTVINNATVPGIHRIWPEGDPTNAAPPGTGIPGGDAADGAIRFQIALEDIITSGQSLTAAPPGHNIHAYELNLAADFNSNDPGANVTVSRNGRRFQAFQNQATQADLDNLTRLMTNALEDHAGRIKAIVFQQREITGVTGNTVFPRMQRATIGLDPTKAIRESIPYDNHNVTGTFDLIANPDNNAEPTLRIAASVNGVPIMANNQLTARFNAGQRIIGDFGSESITVTIDQGTHQAVNQDLDIPFGQYSIEGTYTVNDPPVTFDAFQQDAVPPINMFMTPTANGAVQGTSAAAGAGRQQLGVVHFNRIIAHDPGGNQVIWPNTGPNDETNVSRSPYQHRLALRLIGRNQQFINDGNVEMNGSTYRIQGIGWQGPADIPGTNGRTEAQQINDLVNQIVGLGSRRDYSELEFQLIEPPVTNFRTQDDGRSSNTGVSGATHLDFFPATTGMIETDSFYRIQGNAPRLTASFFDTVALTENRQSSGGNAYRGLTFGQLQSLFIPTQVEDTTVLNVPNGQTVFLGAGGSAGGAVWINREDESQRVSRRMSVAGVDTTSSHSFQVFLSVNGVAQSPVRVPPTSSNGGFFQAGTTELDVALTIRGTLRATAEVNDLFDVVGSGTNVELVPKEGANVNEFTMRGTYNSTPSQEFPSVAIAGVGDRVGTMGIFGTPTFTPNPRTYNPAGLPVDPNDIRVEWPNLHDGQLVKFDGINPIVVPAGSYRRGSAAGDLTTVALPGLVNTTAFGDSIGVSGRLSVDATIGQIDTSVSSEVTSFNDPITVDGQQISAQFRMILTGNPVRPSGSSTTNNSTPMGRLLGDQLNGRIGRGDTIRITYRGDARDFFVTAIRGYTNGTLDNPNNPEQAVLGLFPAIPAAWMQGGSLTDLNSQVQGDTVQEGGEAPFPGIDVRLFGNNPNDRPTADPGDPRTVASGSAYIPMMVYDANRTGVLNRFRLT